LAQQRRQFCQQRSLDCGGTITKKNDITDNFTDATESMTDVDDVNLCFILTLLYARVQELTSSYFVQSELNSLIQQDQSICKYYKRKRLGLDRREYPQWSVPFFVSSSK
jgi:hypothetical protein